MLSFLVYFCVFIFLFVYFWVLGYIHKAGKSKPYFYLLFVSVGADQLQSFHPPKQSDLYLFQME